MAETKAERLSNLTASAQVMKTNQAELHRDFCPVCIETPSKQMTSGTFFSLIFVSTAGLLVGTAVTGEDFKQVLSSDKKAFLIGVTCQFGWMPLYVYMLSHIFADSLARDAYHSYEAAVLGMAVVGCLPGGTGSNVLTWLVDGNVPMSILMSLFSNTLCLGATPLLLYLYYEVRFSKDDAPAVPYFGIILPLAVMVVAVGVGMLLKRYANQRCLLWTQRCSSGIVLLFFVLAVAQGLMMYNYILTWSPSLFAVGLTLQPMGYAFGWLVAKLCKCNVRDRMTIAFEAGVQQFSLGFVFAELGFNRQAEQCQFAEGCMRLIDAHHEMYGSKYGYSMHGAGRLTEGSGENGVSVLGFLPGNSTNREFGGCCRPEELAYLDVWKFSGICGLFSGVHLLWFAVLLRKLYLNHKSSEPASPSATKVGEAEEDAEQLQ